MAETSNSAREYVMAAEAALMLAAARVSIALLPLRILGSYRGRADPSRPLPDPAAEVTLAVERAARRLPVAMVCYPRALAVHWMLRRRGVPTRLHFGLRPPAGDFAAHVWVSLGDAIICGAEEANSFASVISFPAHSTDPAENHDRVTGVR